MMANTNIKTVLLTGSEIKAEFNGYHAWIRNDGASVVYAAKQSGITAGADDVVSIPSGCSAPVLCADGEVYLLGAGSVMLIGSDYSTNPFKTSAQSSGSGADEVARAAVETHAGNAEIHVTADNKIRLNSLYNPNLLDNPDFRVNQRGVTGTVTLAGAFIDRWKLKTGSVTINSDGSLTLNGTITQTLDNSFQGTFTASASAGTAAYDNSAKTYSITSAGDTITWAKLEHGGAATDFIAPDPATELAKCQRYLYVYRHQNTMSTTDKCTIGVGFALTDSIVYAVLPIAAMKSKTIGKLDIRDLSLIKGTDTVVEYSNATISEQTNSTLQIAFAVSGQTPGIVYRLRLMNSDAYLAVSKEI